MAEEERGAKGPDSVWNVVGQHAGWGLTIAFSIGLFLWLGYLADGRLGTTPLLTIVGAFLGGAAGFYSMFRRLVAGSGGDAARKGGSASGDDR